jgi:hypothetical protein
MNGIVENCVWMISELELGEVSGRGVETRDTALL